ncbi:MAG TPA: hypothetical protein VN843_06005 [Anaerolineales bacterium]|nr:hypothetical protein [Anaerolineales bacterium]
MVQMETIASDSSLKYIITGTLISMTFITAKFFATTVDYYMILGCLAAINEVSRVLFISFAVIFLLYGIYLIIHWIINRFQKPTVSKAVTD